MRVLVTGVDGFVGGHMRPYLKGRGDHVIGLRGGAASGAQDETQDDRTVDVRDAVALRDAVAAAKPDAIIHLAGVSSVARSHEAPSETFEINTLGTLNVLLAARAMAPNPRVLFVSSGEVYGATPPGAMSSEEAPLRPLSPYAASKVAAETVAMQFARSYGLPVVCARPFSHLGAGQAPAFAIPSFARQIAQAKRSGTPEAIAVGDLSPVRDFLHVGDVVAAYRMLLLERGVLGETYNVCSGEGRTVRSVLDELIELAGVAVTVSIDPARLRPSDLPRFVGDGAKLRALGWAPRSTVRDALTELLAEVEGA